MSDVLDGLPRHGDEALGPCACCGKVILATAMPIFYRLTVEHCGVDANAVRERVGLAMMMGGGERGLALSAVMGGRKEPVVVVSSGTANVCGLCANERPDLLDALFRVMEVGNAA